MVETFESLFEKAKKNGPKKIAVAVAQDEDVLGAVKLAYENKIVDPILVGDEENKRNSKRA
jgi:phosphate butyryltransferase (EC 2.3.1.19)